LPVSRADGLLAASFNGLLERIQREEDKAAEHAANQLLRKIVSQIPGVVFQYRLFADGHGCFPFASEAFYDLYGIRPEAVSHSADAIRELVHPEDRDSFFDALQHSAAR
jgi:PAS domain-containing protein